LFSKTIWSTDDADAWHTTLQEFTLKDPHYLPEYLKLFEQSSNLDSFLHFSGQGLLYKYGDSKNYIIYPFFKRALSSLPFAHDLTGFFDIVSPYGYGGPLGQIRDDEVRDALWRGFYDDFSSYCRSDHIVSEFARLHPIFENAAPIMQFSTGIVQNMGSIIYLDLFDDEKEIQAGMSRQRNSEIKIASQNPRLKHVFLSDKNSVDDFYHLYSETMTRNNADRKFFFTGDFFARVSELAIDKTISFGFCQVDNKNVSGAIILSYGGLSYYWLAGSTTGYSSLHCNDLNVYLSSMDCKHRGDRFLILGGGRGAQEDSLFTYKKRFSNKRKEFFIYKKVHLEDEYSRLVRLRNQYYNNPAPDFFPVYRS
jgi:hypothetical protein